MASAVDTVMVALTLLVCAPTAYSYYAYTPFPADHYVHNLVHNQVPAEASLEDLEKTPYILNDGTHYRDMLTVEASKAVAQFGKALDRRQPKPRRTQEPARPYPLYYTNYLDIPIGRVPATDDQLSFTASRHVRLPADLQYQRDIADHDEAVMLLEAEVEQQQPQVVTSSLRSRYPAGQRPVPQATPTYYNGYYGSSPSASYGYGYTTHYGR